MAFSLGKISLSVEEIIPFECYNSSWCAKIETNDVTLQHKLRHFQTSEKPKNGQSNKCNIYKLMYL